LAKQVSRALRFDGCGWWAHQDIKVVNLLDSYNTQT